MRPLPTLRSFGQRRWQNWVNAHHPRRNEWQLTHRNVYILPTSAGWLFVVLLLCLLVASINYQLNLGHLLTFTLASAALVALQTTHATLRGLMLSVQPGESAFVGQSVAVSVHLRDLDPREPRWHRPTRLGRHGICLQWRDDPDSLTWVPFDAASASATVTLAYPLRQRGQQNLPALRIACSFPLGLFQAWSWWRIEWQPMAWPTPESDAPPPPCQADPHDMAAAQRRQRHHDPDDEDRQDMRPWRRGDRLNQILWKPTARSLAADGEPWVREQHSPPPQQPQWHLDGSLLADLDPEARLARLSAWVLQADAAQVGYSLSLPPAQVPHGEGRLHRDHCLDTLATWGHTT